jgi:hypothetical protein
MAGGGGGGAAGGSVVVVAGHSPVGELLLIFREQNV